ncbi:Y-family DNA polymerase [Schinkia azotoformans]|uniref:Y-family DNA polymerase n=1 Tax=Schinkia azotoformans TaxID=1454 RepID=UPI002DBAAE62|nr:UV damage repair protein UvrX [Schinkia azotoformans]MEC1718347.1 UV damage repair protein UvrX [Schinkia azotoformans]MEC1742568.1 UV damage repair protein UvrX [Schinkia azotoformans]MEC1745168.1 UV damage repair protein UvrX [Schinkia azotoformans]MEC1759655.1 UV damage repair protein UvrX [Schinkia azotoformans]MEC1766689.1 UV damage repair protein UvrX [Schinkia azotoformans]
MISYSTVPHHEILCIDMKSFFASCAAVQLGLDPVTCYLAVIGDTDREGSIVLASSPKMKSEFGIKTGNRLFEIPNDPRIKIVNTKMGTFLKTSTEITKLFNQFVPKECIHMYSIDESFLKIDGTERLWGSTQETAEKIREAIKQQFNLPCAIGIGPNMLLAKLCLDLEAKKSGIAKWTYEDVKTKLWNISPLSKMWGIGSRLERTLNRMGIMTVGQLANYPLTLLEKKFGIMGNQLYYHAHGIDFSELGAPIIQGQLSFGKGQILMRDYEDPKEVKHVILEMCEEVARRARNAKKCGKTISLSIGNSKDEGGGGFQCSRTIPEPTNITMDIYRTCVQLFDENFNNSTVRQISIALSNVCDDEQLQLSLFEENKVKERELGYVMDAIRKKHGPNAILRAVSYTKAGTSRHRNKLVGGHKA